MGHIHKVSQLTRNPHVNLYGIEATGRTGKDVHYYVSSRAKNADELKLKTKENYPDGVAIYSLYGEKKDHVVLVRQYRYTIDDYIYEFPAGLVEGKENYREAGIREMKEETGLTFTPLDVDPAYERPFFTTVGMTDEACATVYGYAEGIISDKGLDDTEELEIMVADRNEVKRILREEKVAIICAYMLMHFLNDGEEPFGFLKNL